MTPDMIDEFVVNLMFFTGMTSFAVIGCAIADYVFPRVPFIRRWLDLDNDNWED